MPGSKELTATNLSRDLDFSGRLNGYDLNIEEQGKIESDIGRVKRQMKLLSERYLEREGTLLYPPPGAHYDQVMDNLVNVGGPSSRLFVYLKNERIPEFDKLYSAFGNISGLMKDSVAMKELESKFSGLTTYLQELAEYVYTPENKIAEKETNQVRQEYLDLEDELNSLLEKYDLIKNKVENVERYVNTVEKVSNIARPYRNSKQ